MKYYPNVGMIIATDFSKEMLKIAKKTLKEYPEKCVKFANMNNLDLKFPNELFDLVSDRHTVIDAKAIYKCLASSGKLV